MADKKKTNVDVLLEDLGGCGPFQWLIVLLLHCGSTACAWSMLLMAYGAYNPGWKCANANISYLDNTVTVNALNSTSASKDNEWISSSSCSGYSRCDKILFNDDSSTVATEWNLICDNFYKVPLIISIQMAGVLSGIFLCGIACNWIGRKPTHFLALMALAVINVVLAQSVNWQMFAALRFLIGIPCGFLVVTPYLYPTEFVVRTWRSVVAALPFWNVGALSFAAIAMFLRDWRHLHYATSIIALVLILPVLWVPESMRWLVVTGKTEKAFKVGLTISKLNRQSSPNMSVLSSIAEEEKNREKDNARVSVLDLYKGQFRKRTLLITFLWLNNTMVYYAINYGVKSLSGHFYLNLMITSFITTISCPFIPLAANTLGRKFGCLCFLSVAALACVCMVVLHYWTQPDIDKGLAVQILTFVVLIFVDGGWCVAKVYTVELFPTPLRSLGYSHASSVARIGGMIAPFLIPKDESSLFISHIIMAICILAAGSGVLFLPETSNTPMEDTIPGHDEVNKSKMDVDGNNHLFTEEIKRLT